MNRKILLLLFGVILLFSINTVSAICVAAGGTLTLDGSFCVHTFTSSGTFNITTGTTIGSVSVLTVGGGGSGGGNQGGGGGAGGLIFNNSVTVTGNQTVIIGLGGIAVGSTQGNRGGNSSFGTVSGIAIGGGGGKDRNSGANSDGGSGGGASFGNAVGGLGTTGQGNAGSALTGTFGNGAGGGAGGAGQANGTSNNGGRGGIGLNFSINGTNMFYAGGGGGGAGGGGQGGAGGLGGGGQGGDDAVFFNVAGGVNGTGGGGGGTTTANNLMGGGSGVVIVRYANTGIVSVNLTNPVNNTLFSSGYADTFNATATLSGATVVNATRYLYNSAGGLISTQFTAVITAGNRTNFTIPALADGNYSWNIQMCDNGGICIFAPGNFSFSIETVNPIVNVFSPSGLINGLAAGQNLSINFSVTDSNLAFCWRDYNGVNTTIPCTTNSSLIYVSGVNTVTIWANDTFGNIGFDSTSWNVGTAINNVNFSNVTFETAQETFRLNFSSPNIIFSTAILVYNGTNYTSTVVCTGGGNNCIATNTIDIPLLIPAGTLQQNLTFFWIISSFNGSSASSFSSATYTQTVNNLVLSYCPLPTGSSVVSLNFTAYDEQNRTRILPNNMFSFDGTFDYYKGSGSVSKQFNVSSASINEVDLCVNRNTTYFMNAIIAYSAPNSSTAYVARNHFYQNFTINNTMKSIPLYLLRTASSTSFILQVQDRFIQGLPNVLINAQRCYPGTNNNETVFIHRTDSNGQTTGNFEAETALYQFFITRNSQTLLAVTPCAAIIPGTSPFTLLFQLGTGFINPFPITSDLANLTSSLTFNSTSGLVTFTYIDTSGNFSYAQLIVRTLNASGSSETTICDSNNTLSSGVITCSVTTPGTYYAQGLIFRDQLYLVNQITFSVQTISALIGNYGVFLGWFIILISAFAFKFNEIAGIWLMNVAVIFVNVVGFINFGAVFIAGMIATSIVLTGVLDR